LKREDFKKLLFIPKTLKPGETRNGAIDQSAKLRKLTKPKLKEWADEQLIVSIQDSGLLP